MSTTENKRTVQLRVAIRRDYGAHQISFEIAEQVEISNGQERRDAFMNLQAQLEDQINVYEHVSLPHVKLPSGSIVATGNDGWTTDTFPISKISVEFKQGKRWVAAHGGKWQKFGVAVYKECSSVLNIEDLALGDFDCSHLNLTATISIKDGSAKRVDSIK